MTTAKLYFEDHLESFKNIHVFTNEELSYTFLRTICFFTKRRGAAGIQHKSRSLAREHTFYHRQKEFKKKIHKKPMSDV